MRSPIEFFSKIEDPRVEKNKDHLLEDIIVITIAAVICGSETGNDIEIYGKAKESWLKTFLRLPNGIPSHDTFNRLFSSLEPQQFEDCFLEWVKEVSQITEGEIVSIDGKTIRGSKAKDSKYFVHMVSACANENHLVLGQVKVEEKSNEITAIPKLLEVLCLSGCIVTIDAMGCQSEIARKIIDKGADYILAVKGNQGLLEEGIKDTIRFTKPTDEYEDLDFGHGRIENRKCSVYTDFSQIDHPQKWEKLTSVIKIEATRFIKSTGKQEQEIRYYISSLPPNARKIGSAVRSHWAVENSLHWVLDVSFGEDRSMKHNQNAIENFSVINRIALNLVKSERTKKRSVKGKR